MAAMDFPSSPVVGTVHPTPALAGLPQYTWDGEKWTSGTGFGNIYISDSAPAAPVGSLWWESDTGILYLRYNDGTSTQWVAIAGGNALGGVVRYDVAQTLTAAQQVQARQNVYAAPFDALAYNGMQTNGSMEVAQERGYSSNITANGYICDGWTYQKAGTMVAPVGVWPSAPAGFSHTIAMAVTTAQASLGGTDNVIIMAYIEGYRIKRLAWGTANAQPITIGFWTAHYLPGTYTGTVRNAANDRSCAFSYTHTASSVWEYKTVTIPGDTAGTWNVSNGVGVIINFAAACGTSYAAPAINTWYGGGYIAGPGQVNAVASTSYTFNLTGLVVLPGIELPSAARAPLIMRPYDQELLTCMRYYEALPSSGIGALASGMAYSTTAAVIVMPYKVVKRAAPTFNVVGAVSDFSLAQANTATTSITALGHFNATLEASLINATGASALVAGNATYLHRTGGASKLGFDARL